MVRVRIRPHFILGGAFLLCFLLSLLLYFVAREQLARRTLFFPSLGSSLLSGEERLLPLRSGQEANLRLLVEEVILGPAQSAHLRVLPRRTRLDSLILRHGSMHLSLSREALFSDGEGLESIQDAIQAVGDTVWFNFPRLRHVYIYIDGQVPRFARGGGEAAGAPAPAENGEVLFRKSLLR